MFGRALEFGDDLAQRHRQPLPAIFRRRRQTEPAALGHLLEGFLETLRRRHRGIIIPLAAFEIADTVERLQHLFGEFCGLAQNRLAHIGGGVGETGQIVVAIDLEHVVEQEGDVFHGGFVDRHGVLPAAANVAKAFEMKFLWRSGRRAYPVPETPGSEHAGNIASAIAT